MDIVMIGLGMAVAGGVMLVYTATKKGVPYVWNMLKTWWTSAKSDLVELKGDIASAHAKIAELEAQMAAKNTPASPPPPAA